MDIEYVERVFQEVLENVRVEDLRFARDSFWVVASILGWVVFWDLAKRHNENHHAQVLVWTIVFVAGWATDNL
jgi:hypothetical protein